MFRYRLSSIIGIIQFASLLAIIPLLIGIAISLFLPGLSFISRLILASMPAMITFFAAILLSLRDLRGQWQEFYNAQKFLLAQQDTSEEEYLNDFNDLGIPFDIPLALEIRQYVAKFLDVPVSKVKGSLDLHCDLNLKQLYLPFVFQILQLAYRSRSTEEFLVNFHITELSTIRDLVVKVTATLQTKGS